MDPLDVRGILEHADFEPYRAAAGDRAFGELVQAAERAAQVHAHVDLPGLLQIVSSNLGAGHPSGALALQILADKFQDRFPAAIASGHPIRQARFSPQSPYRPLDNALSASTPGWRSLVETVQEEGFRLDHNQTPLSQWPYPFRFRERDPRGFDVTANILVGANELTAVYPFRNGIPDRVIARAVDGQWVRSDAQRVRRALDRIVAALERKEEAQLKKGFQLRQEESILRKYALTLPELLGKSDWSLDEAYLIERRIGELVKWDALQPDERAAFVRMLQAIDSVKHPAEQTYKPIEALSGPADFPFPDLSAVPAALLERIRVQAGDRNMFPQPVLVPRLDAEGLALGALLLHSGFRNVVMADATASLSESHAARLRGIAAGSAADLRIVGAAGKDFDSADMMDQTGQATDKARGGYFHFNVMAPIDGGFPEQAAVSALQSLAFGNLGVESLTLAFLAHGSEGGGAVREFFERHPAAGKFRVTALPPLSAGIVRLSQGLARALEEVNGHVVPEPLAPEPAKPAAPGSAFRESAVSRRTSGNSVRSAAAELSAGHSSRTRRVLSASGPGSARGSSQWGIVRRLGRGYSH